MNWIQNMNRCVGPASWDASKPKEPKMSSSDDDNRVQQRGPEGNLEEYVPRDEHQALREMLRVTGPVAILRNGPLRQAVLALLTDRDELAVNLARADEENDKLRELNRARLFDA